MFAAAIGQGANAHHPAEVVRRVAGCPPRLRQREGGLAWWPRRRIESIELHEHVSEQRGTIHKRAEVSQLLALLLEDVAKFAERNAVA